MQPIDAIAAVMDGGLLGASEMDWVARASLVSSFMVVGALLLSKRLFPTSLLGLWAAMKVSPRPVFLTLDDSCHEIVCGF